MKDNEPNFTNQWENQVSNVNGVEMSIAYFIFKDMKEINILFVFYSMNGILVLPAHLKKTDWDQIWIW